MAYKQRLARRSFIQKSLGVIALSTITNFISLASKSKTNTQIGFLGLEAKKVKALSVAINQSNLNFTFSADFQKSNILLVGSLASISISEICNAIKSHCIIVIEKTADNGKILELKNLCKNKRIHLAEIEEWNNENDNLKIFKKLNYFEIAVNHSKISETIKYLNILSELTVNNGLKICI
jgi:hypothetical protein